jgi:hypothetical protein
MRGPAKKFRQHMKNDANVALRVPQAVRAALGALAHSEGKALDVLIHGQLRRLLRERSGDLPEDVVQWLQEDGIPPTPENPTPPS